MRTIKPSFVFIIIIIIKLPHTQRMVCVSGCWGDKLCEWWSLSYENELLSNCDPGIRKKVAQLANDNVSSSQAVFICSSYTLCLNVK